MVVHVGPAQQLTALEPQLDLSLGPLHRVTGMDHVPVPGNRGPHFSVCPQGPRDSLRGQRWDVQRGAGKPGLARALTSLPELACHPTQGQPGEAEVTTTQRRYSVASTMQG